MPLNLTDYQLNQVKYVSMADYARRVDELESFEDKLAFTTRYLLDYGTGERPDASLSEAIHFAKAKIGDAAAKARKDRIMIPDEAVDPDASEEVDAASRRFMIEPVDYLKDESIRLLMQEANNPNLSEADMQKLEKIQAMSSVFTNNQTLVSTVSDLDVEPTSRDIKARLQAKFGGKAALEKTEKDAKPGFFARMFGRSSTAYANLNQVYEAFHNPDHALYGNMNALDKAATEYLKHVYPTWDPRRGGISKSAISRLASPRKERAMLSLNILKATAEQRESEQVRENIIAANIQKRADAEAEAGDEVLENQENAAFQQSVHEDAMEENSAEAEEAYHANFENVPEAEEDPPSLD